VLLSHGVAPERILFLNLVASPEGLQNVYAKFPQVQCITAWIDEGLDERNFSESAVAERGR
jgi:uracil phosphoribosyltransferase